MDLPIIQRVKELMDRLDVNSTEFSKRIGVAQSTFSNILNRNSDIKSSIIEKMVTHLGISPEWLLTGKGEMLKLDSHPSVGYSSGQPYYNVDFIGGFDLIFNDQTTNPDYNIDYQPYNKDGVLWCNLTGKSMEPEISSGDKIAIKEVFDWDKYISLNETYAIVTKNDLRTVKKVRKGKDSRHWLLVPVNPSYDPQEISLDMVLRVFSVLGCIKTL